MSLLLLYGKSAAGVLAAVGLAVGTSTVTGISPAQVSGTGSDAGTSATAFVGATLRQSVGASTGAGTVTGLAHALRQGVGASAGSSACAWLTQTTRGTVGVAAGTSTASSASLLALQSVAASSGSASATATAGLVLRASFALDNFASVSGITRTTSAATGSISGASTTDWAGVSLRLTQAASAGSSTGSWLASTLRTATAGSAGASSTAASAIAIATAEASTTGSSEAYGWSLLPAAESGAYVQRTPLEAVARSTTQTITSHTIPAQITAYTTDPSVVVCIKPTTIHLVMDECQV